MDYVDNIFLDSNTIITAMKNWVTSTSAGRISHSIIVKVLDSGLEFKLQLGYFIHFRTNTLRKGINPLILPVKG